VAKRGPKPKAAEPTRPGPKRPVECADPLHRGSRVKANGVRKNEAGVVIRQYYKCTPVGHDPHVFPVIVGASKELVPLADERTCAACHVWLECPCQDEDF